MKHKISKPGMGEILFILGPTCSEYHEPPLYRSSGIARIVKYLQCLQWTTHEVPMGIQEMRTELWWEYLVESD
jgi:hypothetical protein